MTSPSDTTTPAGERQRTELADDLRAAQRKVENLETALLTSRTIGTAIGVLVERYRITPDVAFQTLSSVSQHTQRKLRDVASDLIFSGVLPG